MSSLSCVLRRFNEYGLTWLRTARELEGNYDVIMVDARGHGRSDGIASGFSSALLVEDTAGVISTLKLGRTRIIGLSQGGSTVLRLAATYPELVHSFIVAFDPYLTIVRAFLRGHSFHH